MSKVAHLQYQYTSGTTKYNLDVNGKRRHRNTETGSEFCMALLPNIGSSITPTSSSTKMESSVVGKSAKIVLVVASYWIVSITLVFLNKYLLNSKDLKLDAPLFVTWFQCVISVALCALFSILAKVFKFISFPAFHIDLNICKQVLPLSIIFVSMITFNNLCLRNVGIAFYYVGRSLTTVVNVILSYFILKQSSSLNVLICCASIVVGFLLGVDQEGVTGSLSATGVLYGVCASFSVALYSIYIKKILPVVDDNIWLLTLYNNLNAVVILVPLMLVFGEAATVVAFPLLSSASFWSVMMAGGVCGFAIGYVTGLQIQVTSPLTHTISGTAKACTQTVLGSWYYDTVKPPLWWLSNFVVLAGSFAYTAVRRHEMKALKRASLQSVVAVEQKS